MRTRNSEEMPSRHRRSNVLLLGSLLPSRAQTPHTKAPALWASAPLGTLDFSRFLAAGKVMRGRREVEASNVLVVAWLSARSRRYSWRVRVAMAWNLPDRSAEFSALITLARRRSRKAGPFIKQFSAGMQGPKCGMSSVQLTATLDREEEKWSLTASLREF